jgi:type II secretory pathway pseudopilin PulG
MKSESGVTMVTVVVMVIVIGVIAVTSILSSRSILDESKEEAKLQSQAAVETAVSKYSAKARKFLSKDPLEFPLLTLMCGSVRSGKTINVIYKIPQYFAAIGNEYLKVFSGFSKNTVRNNVLIELIPYLENFHGAKVKYNSSSGEMDIKLWGKNYSCLVVGGGKSDSFAAIQGGTWDFWYANELPQHNYSFYNMALSRLTPEQARGIADASPESTNHWLYQEKI